MDRTLSFAIDFGALNDGDILAPLAGYGKWSNFAQFSLFVSKFDHHIPSKIEKNTLFGWVLVRIRAKLAKINLFCMALGRIRSKLKKTPFLVGLIIIAKIEKIKHSLLQGNG